MPNQLTRQESNLGLEQPNKPLICMDENLVIFLQLLLKEIILFEKKSVWLFRKNFFFFEQKSRNSSKSNFWEKIADSSSDQKNTKKQFRVEKIFWFRGSVVGNLFAPKAGLWVLGSNPGRLTFHLPNTCHGSLKHWWVLDGMVLWEMVKANSR